MIVPAADELQRIFSLDEEVFGDVAQRFVYLVQWRDARWVQDGRIEPFLSGVVQEHAV